MQKIWKIYPEAPKGFFKKSLDYHWLTLQILYNRGLRNKKDVQKFFSLSYKKDIHSPFLLSGMKKAVLRAKKAKKNKEKVAIFGDYDTDGVSAATILDTTLRKIGIFPIIYIPDRQKEGFGLNLEAVRKIKKNGASLIITADCGASDYEEIKLANKLGVDVIVTDHHLLPFKIPPAYIIINPHKKNDTYPNKNLSGAGVAFKLASAIIETFPRFFEPGDEKQLLDLVAIATVADMMPLLGENRLLVKYGFLVLAKMKRLGLKILFQVARIPAPKARWISKKKKEFMIENINTHTIGFIVAPRLNAASRMKHAHMAFALLNTTSENEAKDIAQALEKENRLRQQVQAKIIGKIRKTLIKANPQKQGFIIEGNPDWPLGIVGLVAGNLCDEYYLPTFICQKNEKFSKGSCRSIPEINIIKILNKCEHLLIEYGGHEGAGGFSFKNKNLKKLKTCLRKAIQQKIGKKKLAPLFSVDAELRPEDLNLKLERILEKLAPFGEGNPEPVFLIKNASIRKKEFIGKEKKHLKLNLRVGAEGKFQYLKALIFNGANQQLSIKENFLYDFIFTLLFDSWQGEKRLALKIIDWKETK